LALQRPALFAGAATGFLKTEMLSMKFAIAAAAGAVLMLSNAARAATPEGIWLSQDRDTKVRIVNCGGRLCATVVWLGEPTIRRPASQPVIGRPSARARPAGRQRHDAERLWAGNIYNADDGRTYKATDRDAGTAKARLR
jgi:uncharacterized protein (DUF2147 family)